jgi:hypothetical protein
VTRTSGKSIVGMVCKAVLWESELLRAMLDDGSAAQYAARRSAILI